MTQSVLTLTHVLLALIAIGTGVAVLSGLLAGQLRISWTVHFFRCALATSVTGFFFPFHHLLPSHYMSMASVYVAGVAILAWCKFHLAGAWRSIFAISTTIVLYLNVVVAVTQVFRHVSLLQSLAPTLSELPFLVVQLSLMALFVVLGPVAVKRFSDRPNRTL
jgi:hypothetical protein